MNLTGLVTPLVIGLLALSGCGQGSTNAVPASTVARGTAQPDAKAASASVYDTVAATASGFAVGNMMATRVVYVMFDTQCPHCGRLWQAAKPLSGQVRMIWTPIRFIGELSARQGAALLASRDPTAEMDAHERSLEAKRGGLVPPSEIPSEILAKVAANTKLMKEIGAASVPFIVYKNPTTGQSASFEGALETADLRKLLGL